MRKLGSFEPREARGGFREASGRVFRFKRECREGFISKVIKEKNKRRIEEENIEKKGLVTEPSLPSLPSILNLCRRGSARKPSLTLPYTLPKILGWSNE
jgi:hypothetical protein